MSVMSFAHDLGVSIRSLRRRPTYTLLATTLVALGVGTVTAIFTVVNASLLRPLPYARPNELYAIRGTEPSGDSVTNVALGYFQFARYREGTRAFSAVEGYTPVTMKFLGNGEPEPVTGALVSAGFFDALGWQPAMGRTFTRAEELSQSGVIIISHGYWQRRYGGRADIVGQVANVDEQPRTIIGVMPREFSMLFQRADAWAPLPLDAQMQARRARAIAGIARMRPGVTVAQAEADLKALNQTLAAERPEEHRFTDTRVITLREWLFGAQRTTLIVLMVAGCLLLAIAIVNAVSLSLSDAYGRRTATMTRLAFGAERGHIVRLRLIEVGAIASAGLAIGFLASQAAVRLAYAIDPALLSSLGAGALDASVIAVALVAVLIVGVFVALPTALMESRFSLAGLAGTLTKSGADVKERRRRDMLLGAQVALAVILLVSATLLARNIRALLSQPTGFRQEGVTVVELTFSPSRYKTVADRAEYARRLLEAVHGIPGVTSAATIQTRFVLNEMMLSLFEIEGQPLEPGVQRFVNIRHVTPAVANVLGIRLRSGRMFAETDRLDSPPVAIVSATFARQYFPGDDPVGKRMRRVVTDPAPWMEIVGVVDDIRDAGVGVELGPTLFVSYYQQNTQMARPTIVVRSTADPSALFPSLRRAIWSVDPNQTIDRVTQLEDLMSRSASQPRFAAVVAGVLASCAALLVLAGIYAVTLYAVVRRTRELGVRAALGASSLNLIWTTIQRSMIPATAGVVVGVVAAVPMASRMSRMLTNGFTADDFPALVAVAVGVIAVAGIAALIPARRALAISPSIAMRDNA
ncbi:MAG TPA: ADOP family duplicated permease [Gemmatimonadaceae bacterium]|nr:ADOP family duplicated permease [Gemmatimonadaceae bacterium]